MGLGIFENVSFIDNSTTSKINGGCTNKALSVRAYNENGIYIKDCSLFITESMVDEYNGNSNLIRKAAILEGAKMDLAMENWFEEGEDYKDLKAEVQKIVDANDMDDSKLRSKGKRFMHICKRILQIVIDAMVAYDAAYCIGFTLGTFGLGLPIAVIAFVISFIINRLFRLLYDTIEFNTIKKDAQTIVKDLRRSARDIPDKKAAQQLNDEADRLESAIREYSR